MDTPTADDSTAGAALWPTKTGWIAVGMVELLAGVAALLIPGLFASVPVPALVAVLVGACGIARLAHALELRRWRVWAGEMMLALLYLAASLAILARPYILLPDLVTIVGSWCLAVGLTGALSAARAPRLPSWGWMCATSLWCVVLGALLLTGWAERAFGTVELVTSINLMITGIGMLVAGGSLPGRGLVEHAA